MRSVCCQRRASAAASAHCQNSTGRDLTVHAPTSGHLSQKRRWQRAGRLRLGMLPVFCRLALAFVGGEGLVIAAYLTSALLPLGTTKRATITKLFKYQERRAAIETAESLLASSETAADW